MEFAMKNRKYYIFTLALFFLTQILFAQENPKAPLEPKLPEKIENEFEFEFQDFLEMKEEDEKKLLKNLKKELQKNLEVIKKVNKEKYIDLLRESQFKNMKFPFVVKHEKLMHERENKIFEAEVEVEALAAKHQSSTANEQRKIKEELKSELNKLFALKEERRKQEVEELQKELSELKKSLEIRLRNKTKIIERRLQELLEEEEYLEWD
jgi:hypothetical protein